MPTFIVVRFPSVVVAVRVQSPDVRLVGVGGRGGALHGYDVVEGEGLWQAVELALGSAACDDGGCE